MKRAFFMLLLAFMSYAALCPTGAQVNASIHGCTIAGEDSLIVQDGLCTIVACAPASGTARICLNSSSILDGIQRCLSAGSPADLFGNETCQNVKCVDKSALPPGIRNQPDASNSTSSGIVDQLMAFGTKYSTVLGGLATLAIAIGGWLWATRKKSKMGDYLTRIDDTYSKFKVNEQECEAELRKIKKSITEELKKGSLDDNYYSILEKRIDDYLDEVKEAKKLKAKLEKDG